MRKPPSPPPQGGRRGTALEEEREGRSRLFQPVGLSTTAFTTPPFYPPDDSGPWTNQAKHPATFKDCRQPQSAVSANFFQERASLGHRCTYFPLSLASPYR